MASGPIQSATADSGSLAQMSGALEPTTIAPPTTTSSTSPTSGTSGTNGVGNGASAPVSLGVATATSVPSTNTTTGSNGIATAPSSPVIGPVNATPNSAPLTASGTSGVANVTSPPTNVFAQTAAKIRRLNNLTESEEIYDEAVRIVLTTPGSRKGLSEEEVQLITSKSDTKTFHQDIQDEIKKTRMWKRRGNKRFRGAKAVVDTLQRFGASIDLMVQANPLIAGVIWGGIRSLMIIAREVFDTHERLIQLANRTKFALTRFAKYMDDVGIESIKEELLSFHTKMIRFCLDARKVYHRKAWKTSFVIFRSSLERPFGELLVDIDRAATEVEKSADAEHKIQTKAFQQRMLRKGDQPLVSFPPPEKHYWVQRNRALHFTGREDVLEHLRLLFAAAREPDKPHAAALFGLPGVGKSQTAIRYADDSRTSYRYTFFVRSESEENLLHDFRDIAYRLKILDGSSDLKDQNYVAKIFEWLENTPSWLLIFDNVIDMPTIHRWIPRAGIGDILYTTRSSILAERLGRGSSRAFEVQPLEIAQAILLTNRLRNELDPHEGIKNLVRQLCESLGCLPIAINQAIEFENFHGKPLVTLLQMLRSKRDVLDREHKTSDHESNMSVWALYLLTMEAVEEKETHAAALMKLFMHMDTTAIPVEIIKVGASKLNNHFDRDVVYPRGTIPDDPTQALKALPKPTATSQPAPLTFLGWKFSLPTRAPLSSPPEASSIPASISDTALYKFLQGSKPLMNLITDTSRIDDAINPLLRAGLLRNNGDGTIWIHDLVRDILLEHIGSTSPYARDSLAHLSLTMVYLSFPEPPHPLYYLQIYDRCLSHQPHALKALQHCTNFLSDSTIAPELSHLVASFFDFRTHRETSSFLSSAVKYYELAYTGYLASWKRQRQHMHSATSPTPMARVDRTIYLAERATYTLTEPTNTRGPPFARITDQYERFGGPSRRTFDTALKLSFILLRSDPLAALPWAQKAIKGYTALFGAAHDLTFAAMGLQIQMLKSAEQWDVGLLAALRRYEVSQQRSGDPTTTAEGAQTCAEVAFMSEGQGEYADAVRWFGYALMGREAAYGERNIRLAGTLLTMGKLHEKLHQHQHAIEHFVRSRDVCEMDGSELGSALARVEIATTLLRAGKGAEAIVELEWVVEYLRRTHASFDDTYYLTRPIWLKAAWNYGLAKEVIQDGIDVPSDFGGETLVEAEVLFGKVQDGVCDGIGNGNSCSLPAAEAS